MQYFFADAPMIFFHLVLPPVQHFKDTIEHQTQQEKQNLDIE